MAQASSNVRKLRKVKRERTLAFRMAKQALNQRDQARMIAYALEQELKKHMPAEQAAEVRENTPVISKKVEITVLPDEDPIIG